MVYFYRDTQKEQDTFVSRPNISQLLGLSEVRLFNQIENSVASSTSASFSSTK